MIINDFRYIICARVLCASNIYMYIHMFLQQWFELILNILFI